jgi:hypothetical protein
MEEAKSPTTTALSPTTTAKSPMPTALLPSTTAKSPATTAKMLTMTANLLSATANLLSTTARFPAASPSFSITSAKKPRTAGFHPPPTALLPARPQQKDHSTPPMPPGINPTESTIASKAATFRQGLRSVAA